MHVKFIKEKKRKDYLSFICFFHLRLFRVWVKKGLPLNIFPTPPLKPHSYLQKSPPHPSQSGVISQWQPTSGISGLKKREANYGTQSEAAALRKSMTEIFFPERRFWLCVLEIHELRRALWKTETCFCLGNLMSVSPFGGIVRTHQQPKPGPREKQGITAAHSDRHAAAHFGRCSFPPAPHLCWQHRSQ